MHDRARPGGAETGEEGGRLWVHCEDKTSIICHQIRCGRGLGGAENKANCSVTSCKHEGQEGNGSENQIAAQAKTPQVLTVGPVNISDPPPALPGPGSGARSRAFKVTGF